MLTKISLQLDRHLPLHLCVPIAAAYAELRPSLFTDLKNPASRKKLAQVMMRDPLFYGAFEVFGTDHARAIDSDNHSFIRGLFAAAGTKQKLEHDAHAKLQDIISSASLKLHLADNQPRGGRLSGNATGLRLQLSDADLLWFIAIGTAALFDPALRYQALLKPCPNFHGKPNAEPPIPACRNYFVALSPFGRPPESCFECRDRPVVRDKNYFKLRRYKERRNDLSSNLADVEKSLSKRGKAHDPELIARREKKRADIEKLDGKIATLEMTLPASKREVRR